MPPFLRPARWGPLALVRGVFDRLPSETQAHTRAAADEAVAALRSLADGSTDTVERAIDRIARVISR